MIDPPPPRALPEPGAIVPDTPLADLIEAVRPLVAGRPVALLDWPHHPNAGDHMIWLGEKCLLRILDAEVIHESHLNTVDFVELHRLPRDTVLMFHGGGNFGDLYPYHQRYREAMVGAWPDRRIIFMPQSVHYREDAAIARGRDCLARHRDLHVFARDHGSLSLIRDHLGLTGARLAIDSAFFLGPIVRELAARCPPPAEREIRLLRSDAEQGPVAAAVRVTGVAMDWCNPDTSSKPTDDAVLDPARAGIDGLSAFDSAFDRRSWRRLCGAVQMLSRAEYLVTDRLHAHILASMLGIPHTLYDNSYGKNAGFYRCWTAGSALASFMDARSPP